ncbi:plasmid mobilization relaxosome protein MobC [Psychrobacter sp.]|uniref:plasmid mobilization protein n=1 Tax=Psychrobacter sp. TaxID=56811 RepID=UPI0025ED9030|nr:plasmid mobilization relaxosome protein MobC [Psychrobacter sp.]
MIENESGTLDKRAKRTREISIRVNDYELAEIKKRNRGSTVASWLRGLALGVTPAKPVDPELVRQLGRLGSNLNQLTKYVHIENSVNAEVLTEIQAIRQELHRLVEISIEQSKMAVRGDNDC